MPNKQELIHSIDQLIKKHGPDNPDLLRDLQIHRDALANALKPKDIANIAWKVFAVAKFLYDNWRD